MHTHIQLGYLEVTGELICDLFPFFTRKTNKIHKEKSLTSNKIIIIAFTPPFPPSTAEGISHFNFLCRWFVYCLIYMSIQPLRDFACLLGDKKQSHEKKY